MARRMKTRILIAVMVLSLIVPPVSHGFGLLRYAFDAIANQLGLDRGPIPKVVPKPDPKAPGLHQSATDKYPRPTGVYIQAEGF